MLPLLLLLLQQLKRLPADILVPFLGVASAVIIITFPAHVVKCYATIVAKRATWQETAAHQFNQSIRQPEQVSVKPVIALARSGTTRETAPKQQQLATLGGY